MIWLPVVGSYADVDVYASIVAYADLLNQRGKIARAYIPPGTPNYSVPEVLRQREYEGSKFDLRPDDEVIILDVSVPRVITRLVPEQQILELIDHHPGYEEYWQERLGDKVIIEKIGAVATLVFERWGECWDYEKMSLEIAKLLLAAILDNTLYFNAAVSMERDRAAAEKMAEIIGMTVEDFAKWYFSEVSKAVTNDLENSLLLDCKTVDLPSGIGLKFGQLTIWDVKELLPQRAKIAKIMASAGADWVVNIICLAERKNYLLTSSKNWDRYITELLEAKSEDEWLATDRLYLRKEIIGRMLIKE